MVRLKLNIMLNISQNIYLKSKYNFQLQYGYMVDIHARLVSILALSRLYNIWILSEPKHQPASYK